MKRLPSLSVVPLVALSAFSFGTLAHGAEGKKTRDEMVIDDRDELKDNDTWIYNDLDRAREAAAASGKPLLVVFRCIP